MRTCFDRISSICYTWKTKYQTRFDNTNRLNNVLSHCKNNLFTASGWSLNETTCITTYLFIFIVHCFHLVGHMHILTTNTHYLHVRAVAYSKTFVRFTLHNMQPCSCPWSWHSSSWLPEINIHNIITNRREAIEQVNLDQIGIGEYDFLDRKYDES